MSRLLDLAAWILTALLLALLTALSVRGILDPAGAAASFGVGVEDPSAELYQSVYRSRNLMIALAGAAFLVLRMWRALAILTTAAIALPLFDIWILVQGGLPVAAVHPATLAALLLVSALVWRRALRTAG